MVVSPVTAARDANVSSNDPLSASKFIAVGSPAIAGAYVRASALTLAVWSVPSS